MSSRHERSAVAVLVCHLKRPGCFVAQMYILWRPVLETDTSHAAEQVQECLPADDRLRHYWDHDLKLSQAFHRLLQLGQRPRPHDIAWDIFLLYEAGIVWSEEPPLPEFWMHQLFLEDVPELDAAVLKRQLERSLRGDTDHMDLPT
jgi:hypothetical protein